MRYRTEVNLFFVIHRARESKSHERGFYLWKWGSLGCPGTVSYDRFFRVNLLFHYFSRRHRQYWGFLGFILTEVTRKFQVIKVVLAEEDNSGNSQKLRGNVLWKEPFIGEMSMSLSWGNNIVVEIGRKIIEYRLRASDGQGSRSMPVELTHTHTLEEIPLRLSHSLILRYVWVWGV